MNNNQLIKDPVIAKSTAIEVAGNANKLAILLGISRAAVSGWGKNIPPYQAYRLLQIFPSLNNDLPIRRNAERDSGDSG